MQLVSYVDKPTAFHKLDPRVKLLWFAILSIVALAFKTLPVMIVISAGLAVVWIISSITREILSLLRKAVPFIAIASVTWIIFRSLTPGGGGMILAKLGPFAVETSDIYYAITASFYIFITISLFYTIILTTDFSELACGLAKMRLPYAVAFMVSLIFQVIPLLINEVGSIANAQRSRGYELDKGGMVERMKRYSSIAFPLMIRAITLGQNMTIALHIYRFKVNGSRSFYRDLRLGSRDWAFIALFAIYLVFTLYIWYTWR